RALASALTAAGCDLAGPFGRGFTGRSRDGGDRAGGDRDSADVVLLCVPDSEIAAAASLIAPGPLVGHCSGATTLAPLAPHEPFSLHPLMTVPPGAPPEVFDGAGAAIAGSTPRALGLAEELAERAGMHPVEAADDDRAAYHAA